MNSFNVLSEAFFLILILIGNAYAMLYPERDRVVGSCPTMRDNDRILGNKDTFSQEGLLPSLFVQHDVRELPYLKIIRSKILCEAPGYFRNTASSYTMIVEYLNQYRPGKKKVVITIDCVGNRYVQNAGYTFFPNRNPYVPNASPNTATSRGSITLHKNFLATFDTVKKTECGECRFAESPFYDEITGCAG